VELGDHAKPLGLRAVRRALLAHADLRRAPVSLDLLCEFAGIRWSGAAVGISVPIHVVGAARAQTVAAADLARMGEELQVTLGEGPSLDVLAGAQTVQLDDLAEDGSDGRWPMFVPAAVLAGIRSMAVFPMRVGAARFGAFAVYLTQPGGLDPADTAEALTFAPIALDLLLEYLVPNDPAASPRAPANSRAGTGSPGAEGDLGVVLDDRPEIHQATGMMSVQLGVDLPTALLRLRASAFAENRLLSHLAADVVSRVVRFGPPPAGDLGPGRCP
jgi:hypothetical protein